MKNIRNSLVVLVVVLGFLIPLATQAQMTMKTVEESEPSAPTQPRIFYGGGIGLGFGDVEYFEIWPLVGINITPQLGTGVQFLYRYRKDKRYQETLTTDDYGATLFARYKLRGPFYLQAEYEYLNYEYRDSYQSPTTKRDDFSSLMAGGGVSQNVGRNTSLYATALYNFSYDEPDSPYDYPWVIRFGVGVGF